MRRIDVLVIGLGMFIVSGLAFGVLRASGLDLNNAGLWTQVLLVGGLVGWLATYVVRATTGTMTYHQQRRDYEDAVLQKRLEEMTPEELAALQAEIAAEDAARSQSTQ